MTKPRCVLPDQTYLITRRCSQRRFLLKPDPIVKDVFSYALAVTACKYGIEVHAFVVMSNHYHLVVTDVRGKLPDFQRDLNSLIARALNRHWGRSENFWAPESYSAVRPLEDADVIAKIVYVLTNPVAAGLVKKAANWEGATSVGMRFGQHYRVRQPRLFFGKSMPSEAQLCLTRPNIYAGSSCTELEEHIDLRVRGREEQLGGSVRFLGMRRVRAQPWWSCPESVEDGHQAKPTVASHNKWARREALQRCRDWLNAYARALADYVRGQTAIEFPPGTYKMRVCYRCVVANV